MMNWEGAFFHCLSLLLVLTFFYFCDVSFYGIYHSLGVVLTVHIQWESYSKFSEIWMTFQNSTGDSNLQ